MNSVIDLSFLAASLASILWTKCGFDLSNGIPKLVDSLINDLREKNTIDKILNMLDLDLKIKNETDKFHQFTLKSKIEGKEALEIIELKNVEINGLPVKDFSVRVHLCDKELKMKAKITIILNLDLDKLMFGETSDILIALFSVERDISKMIYADVLDRYHLGGVNYICNISSVETDNATIEDIINSTYSKDEKAFENSSLEDGVLVPAYYLLLANRLVFKKLNTDDLSELKKAFDDFKQSRLKIYKKQKEIRAKLVNYDDVIGSDKTYNGSVSYVSTITAKSNLDPSRTIVTHMVSEILAIT